MKRSLGIALVCSLATACGGGESTNNGDGNNGNNGASNNGASNNGASNNGGTNNGGTNNGGTNNGGTNNGGANNGTGAPTKLIVAARQWFTIDLATNEATKFEDWSMVPQPTDAQGTIGEGWDVSPDGSKMVYNRGCPEGQLCIGPADFSAPVEALFSNTDQTGQFTGAPRFSADGTKVYFLAGNSVWSVDVDGGGAQDATEVTPYTMSDSGNFKPFVAKWNPTSTHVISQNGCSSSNCAPTHVGILDISNGMITTISGGDSEISLAQAANEPNCNAGSCNRDALNGGKNADADFGWLDSHTVVYTSTRDQWNTWENGMSVQHGEFALLMYDIDAPKDFADQDVATVLTTDQVPRATSRDGSLYATTNLGRTAVQVLNADGTQVIEHTASFDVAKPANTMRFAP